MRLLIFLVLSQYGLACKYKIISIGYRILLPGLEGNTDIRDICETSLVENYIITSNIFRYCPLLIATTNTEIFSLADKKWN